MGLQVVEHVTQSQYALQLLLPQGDYAGALEIINDIQVSIAALSCCRHNSLSQYQCQLSDKPLYIKTLLFKLKLCNSSCLCLYCLFGKPDSAHSPPHLHVLL